MDSHQLALWQDGGRLFSMATPHRDLAPTATPFRIRIAQPENAAELTAFMDRCFREAYRGMCRDADIDAYCAGSFLEARQRAELRDPALRTLLIAGDGSDEGPEGWAGYAQLRWGEPGSGVRGSPAVEVARFYVDRPWHGRGVAQMLMRAALDVGAAEGARVAWLGVFQRNVRAVRFYEKAGFRIVGEQTFTMGSDVQLDHIMARPIPV